MPVLFKGASGPVASIINAFSAGGVSTSSLTAGSGHGAAQVTAPGAYSSTPGTLQTVISHTGRGRVNVLNIFATNVTARTLRLKLTIDGTVVFDATSNSVSAIGYGMCVVGELTSGTIGLTAGTIAYQPIDYQESLLVEVASSVASDAAANIALGVLRETWSS